MASIQYFPEHFGVNNIPFGVATISPDVPPQCVSRVKNTVIFLSHLAKADLFRDSDVPLEEVFMEPTLNGFASLPKEVHHHVRGVIQNIYLKNQSLPKGSTADISKVQLHLPVAVGDFTDFSASKEHVLNAGEIITGKRALPPAFHSFPVAYGGRASSIVVSGTSIERPVGQFLDHNGATSNVVCEPSRKLDFELEVGAIVGRPVKMGQRPKAVEADEHIFGLVLLNDWSSRDIQGYEMQPLGPFNGKNFGTSISPWVITLEALEPYKVPAPAREEPVASYLDDPSGETYSITFDVDIRSGNSEYKTVCRSNMVSMYWTFRHMLAHQTVGGCNLETGDILASGTVSGASEGEHGCLLEATRGGARTVTLTDGSPRTYLQDGDVVRFTGLAGADGTSDVGFGECVGKITPARPLS